VSARPEEIEEFVHTQVRALAEVARGLGARVAHVKPHGALYHAAGMDDAVAEAIARGAGRASPDLVLVGLAGSPMLATWRALGFRVAAEAFADRRYEAGGLLRARSHADALILDPADAASQALGIATGRGARSRDGVEVPIRADTLCIHGDTPGAVAIARAVRAALEAAGVAVRALGATAS
jgi:UPF0271 protein